MKNIKLFLLAITIITSYSLTAQVAVTNDGSSADGSAMLEVKSTDKGFLPPRMSTIEIYAIASPAEGLIVYCTDKHKPVYYNGTTWMFYDGKELLFVGKFHQGGVIFYLDGSGGGLICAVSDQDGGSGTQWYNGSFSATGALATAIGTGQANTTTIIYYLGEGSYAATICNNYTVGTYSDWFLPSKDELNKMYQNKAAIDSTAIANGGTAFVNTHYWSSSEMGFNNAWGQDFSNGYSWGYTKDYMNRVRAVRAF